MIVPNISELVRRPHIVMEQKRAPLLPAASAKAKPKKEPKTYCFELDIGESNELQYSAYSWLDLVQDSEAKETKAKLESGE